MKRIFISILAVLYLAVASGVEMNIHYCMGEIASVEYGAAEHGPCGKCGMENKKGCCEDESKIVKLEDSHLLSQVSIAHKAFVAAEPIQFYEAGSMLPVATRLVSSPATGPPEKAVSNPLYILHCVYRI